MHDAIDRQWAVMSRHEPSSPIVLSAKDQRESSIALAVRRDIAR